MRKGLCFALLAGAVALGSAASARAAQIHWSMVGSPSPARRIAACTGGTLYELYDDDTLWMNTSGGADGAWVFVDWPWDAESITCADEHLYAFNRDRTLWRLDGYSDVIWWTYIGNPWGAQSVSAGTELAYFLPVARFFALNDDQTLWTSPSGIDGTWRQVGTPGQARRIAVGGTLLESRLFAQNMDRTIWLNWGNAGCDDYWTQLIYDGALVTPEEIAARNATEIYGLAYDGSLWVGSVEGAEDLTSVTHGGYRTCLDTEVIDVYSAWREGVATVDGDFVYATDHLTIDDLVSKGYTDSGVAFGCHSGPAPGTMPLWQLHHAASSDHIYTMQPSVRDDAILAGYTDDGILCWVFDNSDHPTRPAGIGSCGLGTLRDPSRIWHQVTPSRCYWLEAQICWGDEPVFDPWDDRDGKAYSPWGPGNCEGPYESSPGVCADLCPAPPSTPPPPPPPKPPTPPEATSDIYLALQPVAPDDLNNWWKGTAFSFVVPGSGPALTKVYVPSQLVGSLSVGFIRPGKTHNDCGDPAAVAWVAQGSTMSASDMVKAFGSSTPPLPIEFHVCASGYAVSAPTNIRLTLTYTTK